MKVKPFTREEVLELFDVDGTSPSGLRWRINYKDYKKGDPAGYLNKVYRSKTYGSLWSVCFNGRAHSVYRIVWVIERGPIPSGLEVDHLNGDPSDNRIENLSLKTHGHNTRARTKMNSKNTSGFVGVCWSKQKKKWKAQCFRHGKMKHLGFHKQKEDAALAYDSFAKEWALNNGEEIRLLNFKN